MFKKLRHILGRFKWLYHYALVDLSELGYCGEHVTINAPVSIGNPKNVFLYDDVYIGADSVISATNAKFIMKEHASAADRLMVRTGNHMIVRGKFHHQITDEYKRNSGLMSEYDKDVIVEEDAWIGCNVTLLAGVIIGRGTTIGAGSVVPKSIPPYAIAVGVPCKVLKFRWTIDEILEHEKVLYPEDKRLSRQTLQSYFDQFSKSN